MAAASSRRCKSRRSRRSSGLSAGASPLRTSRSPSTPSSAARAAASASPVPRGSACTATSSPSNALAPSGEVTTTSGSASTARAASTTQSTIRRPSKGWKCFGVAERMRVPRPAASTTAAGYGRLIPRSLLGRQDSNLGSRDQNPLPYRLATPQRDLSLPRDSTSGERPRRQSRPDLQWSASQATPQRLATPQRAPSVPRLSAGRRKGARAQRRRAIRR